MSPLGSLAEPKIFTVQYCAKVNIFTRNNNVKPVIYIFRYSVSINNSLHFLTFHIPLFVINKISV